MIEQNEIKVINVMEYVAPSEIGGFPLYINPASAQGTFTLLISCQVPELALFI